MSKNSLNVDAAIKLALDNHQAGNLQQAEHIYKSILKDIPDHAEANHLLGVLAHQKGKHDLAIQLIAQAIVKDGDQAKYYNNLGLALEAQGNHNEALATYRTAIEVNPEYVEAYNNLGRVLQGRGDLDQALQVYQKTLSLKPDYAETLNNLGVILQARGRHKEAIAAYQNAIRIKPDFSEAHNNLGNTFQGLGMLEQALAAYQQAIAIKPDYAGAHNNRGVVLQLQGKLEEALAEFKQAIRLKPDYTDAHNNLGNALQALGRYQESLDEYQRAMTSRPNDAWAPFNRGIVLHAMGRFDEAIASYRRALAINPRYADVHNNMGNALEAQGKLEEAMDAYQQAINIKPDHTDALNNMGVVLHTLGNYRGAVSALDDAIRIDPGFADAHNNRGNTLQAQGRLQDSLAAYRQAIALKPDFYRAHSNLLFGMNYDPGIDAVAMLAAHREWDQRYATGLAVNRTDYANTREPGRRLRIGYVSPDFYQHPVASFIEPVLAAHDHQVFEIICFSNVHHTDHVTERMQKYADKWFDTAGMTDDQVVALVRAEKIDILVDLAGHTAGNRLMVFAHKPAPVQITYLGYPNTTGLTAMDYRLSDAWTDPPGTSESQYSEAIIRIDGGSLCFKPLDPSPDILPIGEIIPGEITFASFNNAPKVNPHVIALWARVLQAVPGARLLMKSKQLDDRQTVERFQKLFSEQGITMDRLEFISWLPSGKEHLALYNRVHIGLDPFPYNGCTTTCEALWMGVPVITLAGEVTRARVGGGILRQMGLDELVAESPEAYIEIARGLATDVARLQDLRMSLREKMLQSSLLDAPGLTRNVETKYREMWQRWCALLQGKQ